MIARRLWERKLRLSKRKLWIAGTVIAALAIPGLVLGPAALGSGSRPTTGVGSCTLKNWNPNTDPKNAKDLPLGHRPQTYRPDDYDCTGAVFAQPGVEFAKFAQPHDFHVKNQPTTRTVRVCKSGACAMQAETVWQPTAAVNPLAPYFPPFTHFVVIMRENHTFDDYLGDCATTIAAGCNGRVQSTNHMGSVPNLHALAKTYALSDSYSTGTQPPSGPNHWWLFTAQSQSSSQQQSYPTATGTQFDRFLGGDRRVGDALVVAGVLVVVELLRDGRAGTVHGQHFEVPGPRVAPVPAAGAEHPVEVAGRHERVRAATAPGAGLVRARVGALGARA